MQRLRAYHQQRHCAERKRRSNPVCLRSSGLLRGACHRVRIRATRWPAMTPEVQSVNQPGARRLLQRGGE